MVRGGDVWVQVGDIAPRVQFLVDTHQTLRLGFFQASSGSKNNTFQFYEDKKHIKKFARADSKFFYIYRDEKHILTLKIP